jgi:hypothetical protein
LFSQYSGFYGSVKEEELVRAGQREQKMLWNSNGICLKR